MESKKISLLRFLCIYAVICNFSVQAKLDISFDDEAKQQQEPVEQVPTPPATPSVEIAQITEQMPVAEKSVRQKIAEIKEEVAQEQKLEEQEVEPLEELLASRPKKIEKKKRSLLILILKMKN